MILLPYLEAGPVADRFDLGVQLAYQAEACPEMIIANYACPSDDAAPRSFGHPVLTRGCRFAKGNFAAYVSPFHVDLQLLYRGALVVGGQSIAAIEDGTSHTIAFSEVRTRDDSLDERGV